MESERATPYGAGERGAGGKFRKPPARKPPSTPYDRPPVNQSAQGRHGGWLSKFVDPAYRLISGSATKLMPSLFSKSSSTPRILPSDASDDHGTCETEIVPNAQLDDYHALDPGKSRFDSEAGPSRVVDIVDNISEYDKLERDGMKNSCDDSELCKIEQLVKGKTFSREEINRLTEILNSKVVSDLEREDEKPSLTAKGKAKIRNSVAPEYPITPVEGKKDVSRAVLGVSSPPFEPNMGDELIASPIDIARAYMGSRTSELGPGSYSSISTSERSLYKGDELRSDHFISQPSPKSSTCWPGAMAQDQRGYRTPPSQRGISRLHNFPRTPYSRTIYSKSKAKNLLQADSRGVHNLSNPFQQPRTPIFGQVKLRTDVDNGYGSGGAIRRIRNRFASETPRKASASLYSLQKGPLLVKESNASKVFFPAKEKNMEIGGTSGTSNDQTVDSVVHGSEEDVPIRNLPSSPVVRGILEHLAKKPTPNDLAAELKIATASKNSPSKDTDGLQNGSTSLTHNRGSLSSHKNLDGLKFSAGGTDGRKNSNSEEKSLQNDAINETKASNTVNGVSSVIRDANAAPSFGFKNMSDSQIRSTTENVFLGAKGQQKHTSQLWPFQKQVNGQDLMTRTAKTNESELLKKQPSQFSGMRPTLKSISVNKPDPKQIISSDNGPGFTFPVSASGVLSEPPTPSIVPSFSSGGLPQPKEGSAVPSYTFGTKGTSPRLDFSSFPSTSNTATHDDDSDLKFSFGSDKKTRASFKLVGKDAICY